MSWTATSSRRSPWGRSSSPRWPTSSTATARCSTCTISPAENERLVTGFLRERADFTLEDPHAVASDLPVWDHPGVPGVLQTLPHRDGTDGFFVARLRKAV